MGNSNTMRELRAQCKLDYEAGNTDTAVLAQRFGVTEKTVRGWINKYGWSTVGEQIAAYEKLIREQTADLERQIEQEEARAYLTALQYFNANPADTNLQSLVGLLKSRQKKLEPSKELNDHIVKFLDQTTDFMVEQGLEGLLKQYQAIVHDLAEYLRVKNG